MTGTRDIASRLAALRGVTSPLPAAVEPVAQPAAHRCLRARFPLDMGLPAAEAASAHLAALGREPRLRDVPLSRLLLLDTETTGLSVGAGTVAWLVCLAWLEPRGASWDVHVEQHVIEEMRQEAAMLRAVIARVTQAGALVSFNGRAYDVPLLESRSVLQRERFPSGIPHLDLLHPARRFLRHALPDVRLASVGERVLGRPRHDDIAGADIPQAWFEYLRTGRTEGIGRAIRHNEEDLSALAALLAWLLAAVAGTGPEARRVSQLALAEHRLGLGDRRGACELLADAAARPAAREETSPRLARLTKRLLGPEAARPLWAALMASGCPCAEPWEEAAKLLEHRDRDTRGARGVVLQALRRFPSGPAGARLLRRQARLARQCERLPAGT